MYGTKYKLLFFVIVGLDPTIQEISDTLTKQWGIVVLLTLLKHELFSCLLKINIYLFCTGIAHRGTKI
jgi:hypothetical protein